MNVWIARDQGLQIRKTYHVGELFLYTKRPTTLEWNGSHYAYALPGNDTEVLRLNKKLFPEIGERECKEYKLIEVLKL